MFRQPIGATMRHTTRRHVSLHVLTWDVLCEAWSVPSLQESWRTSAHFETLFVAVCCFPCYSFCRHITSYILRHICSLFPFQESLAVCQRIQTRVFRLYLVSLAKEVFWMWSGRIWRLWHSTAAFHEMSSLAASGQHISEFVWCLITCAFAWQIPNCLSLR